MSGLDRLVGRHDIVSPSDMEALGEQMGRMLHAGDVVVLTGPLGAGKTTLTRGIGEGLGVRGPVQSPTFVLARTHPSLVGGSPLVHMDAYRLGSAAELDDLDVDVEGSVVVVEWGRGLAEDLADVWWDVEIERPVGAYGADTAWAHAPGGSADRASDAWSGRGDGPIDEELDADAPRVVTVARVTR